MSIGDWVGSLVVAAAFGTSIGTTISPEPQQAIAVGPNGHAVLFSSDDEIDEERFETLETAVALLLRKEHLGDSYFQNAPQFADELRTPLEVLADITDTEEAVALDEATYQLLDQTLIDEWNEASGN